jgi:DNA-directed RNA polymerase subunit RPC12/RpoP
MGIAMPEAAIHECLICGETFPLTQENHDGYGIVCPHCAALN